MIVHMHEFVAEYAANLTLVEHLQNALRTADGGMPFVTAGREGVGAHGRRNVDARHRLARLCGQFAHDFVQHRRLLLADGPRTHRRDGQFVGKPVRDESRAKTDENVDAKRALTTTRSPPNQHDDAPHQREKQRCLQAIAMAMHPQFAVHRAQA